MNGDKVAGSIQVQSNVGATTINGNTVGVSVQDLSNTGATQVFNNTIVNALQCSSNAAITGGLSGPAVRYQARLAWLFAFAPAALLLAAPARASIGQAVKRRLPA